jgi:hypothetical protein
MRTALELGLLGAPGAGRTRWLATLLDGWSKAGTITNPSAAVRSYVEAARPRRGPGGEMLPAADLGPREPLRFEAARGEGRGTLRLTVRDLPGERAVSALDALAEEGPRAATARPVLDLLRTSDALLYVVDPVPDIEPASRERHRDRERRRVLALARAAVAVRGNRYLPILVVLGHRDRWGDQPSEAEAWATAVHRGLRTTLRDGLAGFHPPELADRGETVLAADLGSFDDAERVAIQAARLVTAVRQFDPTPWPLLRLGRAAVALAAAVALVAAVLLLRPASPNAVGVTLPGLTEAREWNARLRAAPGGGEIPAADARELRDKAKAVAAAPAEPGLAVLAACLDGLSGGPADLAAARADYWTAVRRRAVVVLGETLRGATPPDPARALTNAAAEARRRRAEAAQSGVPDEVGAKAGLLAELEEAAVFAEGRRAAGGYAVKARVVSARITGDAARRTGNRRLTLASPPKPAAPALTLRAGTPSADGLPLEPPAASVPLELALGGGVSATLEARNAANTGWDAETSLPAGPPPDPLGLGVAPTTITLTGDGTAVRVELTDAPPVPSLLAEAARTGSR